MSHLIIAIDGPVSAGKSTVAKLVAQKLGYLYIDTGAMYRALAWKVAQKSIKKETGCEMDIYRSKEIAEIAEDTKIELTKEGKVFVDGQDVTEEIRKPEIGELASTISTIGEVRQKMVQLQREMGKGGDVVIEGRDIQTVVFPEAEIKIFLTASLEERAKRRYLELRERGLAVNFEQVKEEIKNRDFRDSTRDIAPLRKAPEAITIDTDGLTVAQVVDRILEISREKRRPLK